jgi:hypothetical protein
MGLADLILELLCECLYDILWWASYCGPWGGQQPRQDKTDRQGQ